MTPEVTGTVMFQIWVQAIPTDENRWVCTGLETGIVTHGQTMEHAIDRNVELHEHVTRRLKKAGAVALANFLNERGIEDFTVIQDAPIAKGKFARSKTAKVSVPVAA